MGGGCLASSLDGARRRSPLGSSSISGNSARIWISSCFEKWTTTLIKLLQLHRFPSILVCIRVCRYIIYKILAGRSDDVQGGLHTCAFCCDKVIYTQRQQLRAGFVLGWLLLFLQGSSVNTTVQHMTRVALRTLLRWCVAVHTPEYPECNAGNRFWEAESGPKALPEGPLTMKRRTHFLWS